MTPPPRWQDLYAENRATITRALSTPGPDQLQDAMPGADRFRRLLGRRLPRASNRSGAVLPGVELPGGLPGAAATVEPPQPGGKGRWISRTLSDRGRRRPYWVYCPPGASPEAALPLLVMLHGCTQTASSLAAGTRANQAADRHGFLVAYPQQTAEDNDRACWNWFERDHQIRGRGEPGFIAGVVAAVAEDRNDWSVDPKRIFVAGMSAGGAMAAVVGATHPDLVAGIAVHSGLAFRSASGLPGAFTAMAKGADHPDRHGRLALQAMGRYRRIVPTMVVHGTADHTVSPENGRQVVAQWLQANRESAPNRFDGDFEHPTSLVRGQVEDGHSYTRRRWADRHGKPVVEQLEVNGLGHGWSGGAAGGSHTDPRGPSATDAIWDFFREASD